MKSKLRVLFLMALLSWGLEQQASAYTDPGSGVLIWQMLMAACVGGMFYLRKFASRIFKKDKSRSQEKCQE